MKKLSFLIIPTVLSGAAYYYGAETIDQNIYQSTLIEINETGQVTITEPLPLPFSAAAPAPVAASPEPLVLSESVVEGYNNKNKKLVIDIDKILQDSESQFQAE